MHVPVVEGHVPKHGRHQSGHIQGVDITGAEGLHVGDLRYTEDRDIGTG